MHSHLKSKEKWSILTSNGDERDNEVRRIGGDEVRESGGEDIWSVPNSTATLVYEFQLLFLQQKSTK